jgi:hypothetical protein
VTNPNQELVLHKNAFFVHYSLIVVDIAMGSYALLTFSKVSFLELRNSCLNLQDCDLNFFANAITLLWQCGGVSDFTSIIGIIHNVLKFIETTLEAIIKPLTSSKIYVLKSP